VSPIRDSLANGALENTKRRRSYLSALIQINVTIMP